MVKGGAAAQKSFGAKKKPVQAANPSEDDRGGILRLKAHDTAHVAVPLEGAIGFEEIEALFDFNLMGGMAKGDDEAAASGGTCGELRDMEATVYCTVGTFIPATSSVIDGRFVIHSQATCRCASASCVFFLSRLLVVESTFSAHWGESLSLLEVALEKTVKVHSFEAIPANVDKVQAKATKRTTVVQAALTTQKTTDGSTTLTETVNCRKVDCSDDLADAHAVAMQSRQIASLSGAARPNATDIARLDNPSLAGEARRQSAVACVFCRTRRENGRERDRQRESCVCVCVFGAAVLTGCL